MTTAITKNRLRNVFPSAISELDNFVDHLFGPEGVRPVLAWRSPVSIWEHEGTIHVELDVPGVSQDDVELTLEKGTLKIAVSRTAPEGDRKYWHNERSYGKVTRTVSLPETADPESITAELNSGVLHVTIAQVPEAQPKRIEVKAAG